MYKQNQRLKTVSRETELETALLLASGYVYAAWKKSKGKKYHKLIGENLIIISKTLNNKGRK